MVLEDNRNKVLSDAGDDDELLPEEAIEMTAKCTVARAAEYQLDIGKDGLLGCSSIGTVVKTRHRSSGALRAFKRIDLRKLEGSGPQAEVEKLRELDHQHICKIYDSWEDGEGLYLVMELCRGGNLLSLSSATSRLNEGTLATLTLQMIGAVEALHGCDLVHGDLRPENWLFADPVPSCGSREPKDLTLKMIDFGLTSKYSKNSMLGARKENKGPELQSAPERKSFGGRNGRRRSSHLTMDVASIHRRSLSGHVFSRSVFCRAPEQMLSLLHTEKSDIWALGVIVYFMLSGQSPFYQKCNTSPLGKDASFINARFVFMPTEIWRPISAEAKHFIVMCLQKDPQQRLTASQLSRLPWVQLLARAADEGIPPTPTSTSPRCRDSTLSDNSTVATCAAAVPEERLLDALKRISCSDPPLPTADAIGDSFKHIQRLQLVERSASVAAAHQTPTDDIQALMTTLQELDTQETGVLLLRDLLHGLERRGVHCPYLLEVAEELGEVPIIYVDFIADVYELQRNIRENADWAAFQDFDKQWQSHPKIAWKLKNGYEKELIQEAFWQGLMASYPSKKRPPDEPAFPSQDWGDGWAGERKHAQY